MKRLKEHSSWKQEAEEKKARAKRIDDRNERYVVATERQAEALVVLVKVFGGAMKKLVKASRR